MTERDKLITSHLELLQGYCRFFSNKYRLDYEDIYSQGCIKLCECATAYRGDGGAKFSTFLYHCLNMLCLGIVRKTAWEIRVGVTIDYTDKMEDVEIDSRIEERLICKQQINKMLKRASKIKKGKRAKYTKEILQLILAGHTRGEAAVMLGLNRGNMWRLMDAIS